MSQILVFQNRQRSHRLNLRLIRKVTLHLLTELRPEETFELGFHFVGSKKMAEVNEQFLQHTGSTDVITFDYAEKVGAGLHGEIFICIEDAVAQAQEFKTLWQSELIRYIVHGVLHLQGFDDLEPKLRKVMKREENLMVKKLAKLFPLSQIERP